MNRLGIEFISVHGLPPVPFAALAGELGCAYLSLGLHVFEANPHNYPRYDLNDAALQRDFKQALNNHGVTLSLLEGFFVLPGRDVSAYARDLDCAAALGAARINTLGLDPDLPRTFDQFAQLAELASARGIETTLEFVVGTPVGSLPVALNAAAHVGRDDFKLVLDCMHIGRSGARPEDIAALDRKLIGYAQICDCPIQPRVGVEEAKYERMPPGQGELPLLEILNALPRDVIIGIEVPQLSLAQAGIGPRERLAPCVAATRALLAQLG